MVQILSESPQRTFGTGTCNERLCHMEGVLHLTPLTESAHTILSDSRVLTLLSCKSCEGVCPGCAYREVSSPCLSNHSVTKPTWILSGMPRKCHLPSNSHQVRKSSFIFPPEPSPWCTRGVDFIFYLLSLKPYLKQISFIAEPTPRSSLKPSCPGKCPACRNSSCEVWQTS